jgi:hypothetical protein
LFESGFGVFDDFLSQHVGIGKVVGFFECFVSELEDVEIGFVAVQLLIHLFKPSPCFLPACSLVHSKIVKKQTSDPHGALKNRTGRVPSKGKQ